eukprot:1544704-Amphidinium_carterae.1
MRSGLCSREEAADAHYFVNMACSPTRHAYADGQLYALQRSIQLFPYNAERPSWLNCLGNAYGALGDYRKQRDCLETVLRIEETHYGPEHVEVAMTLMRLGNAYGDLGDHHEKQRDCLEKALRIFEAHYGPEHVMVANCLNNLGHAYGPRGDHPYDPEKERDCLERALRICEAHYGPEHVMVANPLNNLATALAVPFGALEDWLLARTHLTRAVRIMEGLPGSHPDAVFYRRNLRWLEVQFPVYFRISASSSQESSDNARSVGSGSTAPTI